MVISSNHWFAASRSEVKLKLEMDGFNLNRCSSVYNLAGVSLNQKQLCAGGEQGKDSCSGDSGKNDSFQYGTMMFE